MIDTASLLIGIAIGFIPAILIGNVWGYGSGVKSTKPNYHNNTVKPDNNL